MRAEEERGCRGARAQERPPARTWRGGHSTRRCLASQRRARVPAIGRSGSRTGGARSRPHPGHCWRPGRCFAALAPVHEHKPARGSPPPLRQVTRRKRAPYECAENHRKCERPRLGLPIAGALQRQFGGSNPVAWCGVPLVLHLGDETANGNRWVEVSPGLRVQLADTLLNLRTSCEPRAGVGRVGRDVAGTARCFAGITRLSEVLGEGLVALWQGCWVGWLHGTILQH